MCATAAASPVFKPFFIDNRLQAFEPLTPAFLRDIVVDSLSQLARMRRLVQPFRLRFEHNTVDGSGHFSGSLRLYDDENDDCDEDEGWDLIHQAIELVTTLILAFAKLRDYEAQPNVVSEQQDN